MTADDDLPWSAPWTGRRGAQDEAAFVADVSGALHVPDAAPEIRMIAEVMAILDIPAVPDRGLTVAQMLEQEREQKAADNVVRLRRFAFGRRVAAAVAAAAVVVGVFTVSAYAGVLPDSIQKVAHTMINAPSPKHEAPTPGNAPNSGSHGGTAPGAGGSSDSGSGSGSGSGSTSSSAGASGAHAGTPNSGVATQPGAQSSLSSTAPDPSATDSTTSGGNPPPSSTKSNHGKGHKSSAPATQSRNVVTPGPTPTPTKTHRG